MAEEKATQTEKKEEDKSSGKKYTGGPIPKSTSKKTSS